MEWEILGNLQLWLIIFATGLPSAWVLGWLYRMWRKANLPAFLAKQKQMRRRDAIIRRTRDRATDIEAALVTVDEQLETLLAHKLHTEQRLSSLETFVSQLRQKLKSRGIIFDI